MAKFTEAKKLFRDIVEPEYYIPLTSSEKVKIDLLNAIFQKEKIVLLTGEAGLGKSLILKTVYKQLKRNKDVFLVTNPYLQIKPILSILKELDINRHHILLLDEAQLLSPDIWENLRLYADKGNITIVFATHDTDVNKLLSKKHFKTRINCIIPIKRVSKEEMENFILTKLLKNDFNEIADMFTKNNFNLIYKYTKGSLRATNQIIYKLFDVMEYFYNKNPYKFNVKKIKNKYIFIAIMDLKALDA